jgi:Ser/Thr protein kinase RdoA (MazF antagonist)
LARLHLAAAGFPGELPVLAPLRAQISDALAALEREHVLEPGVLAALQDRHAEILAELDDVSRPELVLHGDAHPGNLLWSAAGWLWSDLEETCTGPRPFDLAVLVRGQNADDAATALAAYADVTGEPLPGPEELAWFDWARALEGAVWALGMAHQYPARYAQWAPALLASVLAATRPSPDPGPGRRMGA